MNNPEGKFCYIAVKLHGNDWPTLVVGRCYQPANGIFFPGLRCSRE